MKKKLIVGEHVVSEPGAGIKITVFELSAEAQLGLSTGGVQIDAPPSEDSSPHDVKE